MEKNQNNIQADKLKGVLITRTAIKTLVPEDIVEKVVMFQFKDFKEVASKYEQIEVSGFGKFLISPAKVRRKIKRLERTIQTMQGKYDQEPEGGRKDYYKDVLDKTSEILAYVKAKKGGYEDKH